MTRIEAARRGIITSEIQDLALVEGLPPSRLLAEIASGQSVVIRNTARPIVPLGVGRSLAVKVNANIGSSDSSCHAELELSKLEAAIRAGAHAVMDLSTGSGDAEIRARVLDASSVPVGTVPLYEAMAKAPRLADGRVDLRAVSADDMLRAVAAHIRSGVDFITVHAGLRRRHLEGLSRRVMGVVSRGGSFLAEWMLHHQAENPFYEHFDQIVALAHTRDVVLSLGDGLRPGATADAGDQPQYAELKTLSALARRARSRGVQAIIEGPGHVPLHQIAAQVKLQKRWCRGAPFYVLGPLVTDCAAGYDHIAGAIGAAQAALAGADFLCYLTPREHLGLPNAEHVAEGVAASLIAAHAADLARGRPRARGRELAMSRCRSKLDWEGMFRHALAPDQARKLFEPAKQGEGCSMCGALCSAQSQHRLSGGRA